MRFRIFLIVLTLSSTLIGCKDDSSTGPGTGSVIPEFLSDGVDTAFGSVNGIGDTLAVDSGFILSFGETVYDSVRSAHKQFLRLTTVQWYSCYNQYLIAQVDVSDRKITVEIVGVQFPGFIFADAFRQSDIAKYFIIEPAEYNIELKYKQDTGHFKLLVTDSSLEATALSDGIFSLQDSLYWRFRPNSCAFVCGMYHASTTTCDRLLDTLLKTARLTQYDYPANGVRPFPSGSAGYHVDWGAEYFTYESESDFERVGELLNAYGNSQWPANSGNGAFLLNYRGKRFMSWYPRL